MSSTSDDSSFDNISEETDNLSSTEMKSSMDTETEPVENKSGKPHPVMYFLLAFVFVAISIFFIAVIFFFSVREEREISLISDITSEEALSSFRFPPEVTRKLLEDGVEFVEIVLDFHCCPIGHTKDDGLKDCQLLELPVQSKEVLKEHFLRLGEATARALQCEKEEEYVFMNYIRSTPVHMIYECSLRCSNVPFSEFMNTIGKEQAIETMRIQLIAKSLKFRTDTSGMSKSEQNNHVEAFLQRVYEDPNKNRACYNTRSLGSITVDSLKKEYSDGPAGPQTDMPNVFDIRRVAVPHGKPTYKESERTFGPGTSKMFMADTVFFENAMKFCLLKSSYHNLKFPELDIEFGIDCTAYQDDVICATKRVRGGITDMGVLRSPGMFGSQGEDYQGTSPAVHYE